MRRWSGPSRRRRRAALVTSLTGGEIPAETVVAIRRAGQLLEAAGWQVEEAEPPELEQVTQTWLDLIATDFTAMLRGMRAYVSKPVCDYMTDVCAQADLENTSNSEIHATRSRLTRLWSEFFVRYPVCVGPTWTQLPWPVDADLAPATGIGLVRDTVRFITPGNVLGLPSVALPTGVAAGLPTGVQVYADLWREDLCLAAAELIEAGVDTPTPIDPLR